MPIEELLRQYALTRDRELRNRIAEMNMPLAGTVAKRFSGRGVEYEDLVQIAFMAMLKALEHFDPDRGVKLSTYLLPSMIGEVRHYFRDRSGAMRLPGSVRRDIKRLTDAEEALRGELDREPTVEEVAEAAGIELSQALRALELQNASNMISLNDDENEDAVSVEQFLGVEETGYEEFERRDLLLRSLNDLTDKEKLLLKYRFKMDLNQRDTAKRMDVSQMTVSRMEKRLIEKLREKAGIE